MKTIEKIVKEDDEPVVFCTKCLSLKIKHEDYLDMDCCGDCGCTDIEEASLDEWEKKYIAKYGHKLVEKNDDPKKSPIFQMTRIQLRERLYNSPRYNEVIHSMYPHFPGGLSRIDSVLLFFDKILQENKLDDFKLLMIKMKI